MFARRFENNPWWRSLRAGFLRLVRSNSPPWLPVAATAVPALLLLVQIIQNWINIPYWDEWRMIAGLRIAMQDGTLGLLDIVAQHNDSRFVLPHLLFLPLARLTHWDLRAEMLSIFATACLISWVLWDLLGKIENLSRPARVACLLVCNCLLFSPLQYETWLWGMNLSLVLPPLFLLLSLRVNLSPHSVPAKVGLNILLCFASTFSNGHGMENWLLAFPAFYHDGRRPERRWLWYGIYLAAAAGTIALFFWRYQSHVNLSSSFQSPALLPKYFLCWLGAPLAIALGSSAWIAGLALSLLFLALSGTALLRTESSQQRRTASAFSAIGCYAAIVGAAITLGRVGLRFEWALSSRYITSSIYLSIAVIGLAALHFSRPDDRSAPGRISSRKLIPALIVIGIFASSLATYRQGMKGMVRTRKERARGCAALLFREILPQNPDLKILCSNPALMIGRYRELLRCGMAQTPFISPSFITKLEPHPRVDRSGGYFRVCELKEGRLRMKGWAVTNGAGPAPFVLFADRTQGTEAVLFSVAPTGNPSPKGAPAGVRNCGFEIKIKDVDLPAGRAEISAWALDPERNEITQLEPLHDIRISAPLGRNHSGRPE